MSKRQQRRRGARRRAHAVVAGGGMAVVATLSTGIAEAANTYTVTNLNDTGLGSLRAAAASVSADPTDSAASPDSIVFASNLTGTISLTSADDASDSIFIGRPVQMIGPGANRLAIHAAPSHRVLNVKAGGKVSGLTLTGGALTNAYGGGIYAGANLELDGLVVSGNSALRAGGVSAYGGAGAGLTVNDSTISGNSAGSAGGIYVTGYAAINRSAIIGNHATSGGSGGARFERSVTVTGSTISGNTATHDGGGIYAYNGGAIIDSTITGNTAPKAAGADSYDGNLRLTGSTVAANTPTGAGGQLASLSIVKPVGSITLQDSVVAGSGSSPDIALNAKTTASASFSLIRNAAAAGTGHNAVVTDSSDKTGVDPKLAPLAFNGGQTETLAPRPGSPVLDAGKAFGLTGDQRGLSRPFALPIATVPVGGDRSDIGAIEEHTPAVAGLSPGSGGAGTHVTISGTGFEGATKVLFGTTPASSFTVRSDAVIVATAPPYNGPADVRVIGPYGESQVASADRFTFPTFKASVHHHGHPKLHGRTLDTGLQLTCPSGGPACSAHFTIKLDGHKLGKGKLIGLRAGAHGELKLKLSRPNAKKLKGKGHHKLHLTISTTDGTGKAITVKKTIAL